MLYNLMINHSNIRSDEYLILYDIPGGKPDNTKMPCEQTEATRTVRLAQKGPVCMATAFNMLSYRVGKHPELQDIPERLEERKRSYLRKIMTALYENKRVLTKTIKVEMAACGMFNEQHELDIDLDIFIKHSPRLKDNPLLRDACIELVERFQTLKKTNSKLKLNDFLQDLYHEWSVDAMEKGLEKVGVDYKDEYTNVFSKRMMQVKHNGSTKAGAKPYDDLTIQEKRVMLNNCYTNFLVNSHRFVKEEWECPNRQDQYDDAFEELFEILMKKGPVLVGGKYGVTYYKSKCHEIVKIDSVDKKFSDKNMEAMFLSADQRDGESIASHVVLVIGMYQRGNKKLVYFIDPNHESKPGEPVTISAMTFDDFCKHNKSVNGFYHGSIYSAPPEPSDMRLRPGGGRTKMLA